MPLVVGIDLGTCNSCVAVYKDKQLSIIENDEHDKITPSFVFYGEEGTFVGKTAILRSKIKPENGIYDVKRLIGRRFNDEEVTKNKKNWPFQIIREHRDEPLISLERNGKNLKLRPEEVSAEVLRKLVDYASKTLDEKIEKVVITVPAYFTNPQKQATENAAKIAGLKVLKLIAEPTAAALAFAQDGENVNNRTVLIYDLGGGTFDVSIVRFEDNEGVVIAHGGDSNLGGRDFDDNLVKYCMNLIRDKYKFSLTEEQKPAKQRRQNRRLKQQCEECKKSLSEFQEYDLTIDDFYGNNVDITISRQTFEDLNDDIFKRTISIVDELLKSTKIMKKQIDDVILVGGSTRIPKIQEMIKEYFRGKKLNKLVNPDEAVAIGAALQASNLSNDPRQINQIWELTDVTAFPIGIQVPENKMSVIIGKSTKIPALSEKKYKTIHDKQKEIVLRVFEGENSLVKDNIFLGELTITGITPKKAGKVEVLVQLHVDLSGILTVTASETSKNITKHLEISLDR